MKVFILCLLVAISAYSSLSYAEPEEFKIDTDLLLANYLDTWSTADASTRLKKLEKIWTENGVHQNPYGTSVGITAISKEIEGFLKTFPDTTIRFEDIKRTGNNIVCTFKVANSKKETVIQGIDYFEFTDKGKLVKVLGFI